MPKYIILYAKLHTICDVLLFTEEYDIKVIIFSLYLNAGHAQHLGFKIVCTLGQLMPR